MANIKISELSELTKKAYDDYLPIVDSSASETKKISVKDLTSSNVELLAVSDTAPSECSTGDKYYNTETGLIYTATATDTWGTVGEEPIEDILYVVFSEKNTYAWNGTDMLSVGGGSGSEIVIGDEEPTEDTKMIIDTDAFNPQYSDITDEYSEANNKAYSCNYVNGKVLYDNATGTSSNISLGTDDVSNYRYIEITAINTDNTQETFSIFKFDTSLSTYIIMGESVSSSSFNIFTKRYTKGVNQLIASQGELYSGSTGRVSNYEVFKITKVVGYNKVGE